jgi:predicted CxxxxCH...CXXCH cytochrome family protein
VSGLTYAVQRSLNGTDWTTISCSAPTATSCGDSGPLNPSTLYYYRASATNLTGAGAWANPPRTDTTLSGPALPQLTISNPGQPGNAGVAAGSVQTPVARMSVTASQDVVVSSIAVQNTGTALPSSDVQTLQLWEDNGATGVIDAGDVLLDLSTWSAASSRYVFSGLSYAVTNGTTKNLLVALNVSSGATVGNTFQAGIATTDVTLQSGAANGSSITGGLFTITAGAAEGDTSGTRPVVLIVNPGNNTTVTSDAPLGPGSGFRVQARVYSPGARALVGNVEVSSDGGGSWTAMPHDTDYGSDPLDGVYETELKLSPGAYVLVVRAANDATPVMSGRVTVHVRAPGTGDGNILVRDNASQLCDDCHALKTHSAQSTSMSKGSWAVSCRACHTPHSTTNIYLVRQQITPPAVNGYLPETTVAFRNKTGKAISSYADDTNTGLCQVCHTRTGYYTRTGGSTHETGRCTTCHGHEKGFRGGGCATCHLQPDTGLADQDDYVYGTAPQAMISRDEWLASGHGRLSTTNYLSGTSGAGFDVQGNSVDDRGCAYCHTKSAVHNAPGNFFRLTRNENDSPGYTEGLNGTCLKCHGNTAGIDTGSNPGDGYILITGSKKVGTAHSGSKHGGSNDDGGQFCWDCHDPHGDRSGGAQDLWYMVQRVPIANSDGSGVPAASVLVPSVNAIEFRAALGGQTGFLDYMDYVGGGAENGPTNPALTTGLCRNCHAYPTISHYNVDTTNGADSHQVQTDATPNDRCTDCHRHSANFEAKCNTCHNSPPNVGKHNRHDEYAFSGQHTDIPTVYSGSTRTDADEYGFACSKCHSGTHMNDSTHAGTQADPLVTQVVLSDGGTYAASGATADQGPDLRWFAWGNGSCSGTYCHANATPLGGTLLTATPTWNETAWTDSNRCTKCHQMAADNSGLSSSTNLSHAHYVHTETATLYGFNCSKCHYGEATGKSDYPTTAGVIADKTRHVNGARNVAFDSDNSGAAQYGTAGAYICSNTYCHSNGTSVASPPANDSIAWNTHAATDCTSCHGGNATATGAKMATNEHEMHINQATGAASPYLGRNLACGRCHSTTVATSNDRAIATYSNHVNLAVGVSMPDDGTWGGSITKTCASAYCHSDGTETPTYRPELDWDAGQSLTNDCKQCHGTEAGSVAGAPWYTNVPANGDDERNGHPTHVDAAADCVDCHDGTVNSSGALIDGALHLNKVGDVSSGSGKPIAGSYTQSGETCTSVTCHGGASSATAQWGGTLDCSGCHMGPTGATDSEQNDYTYNNGTFGRLDPEDWITYGHGRPALSGAYDSGNGAAAFDTDVAISSDDGCKYCHDKNAPHGAFGTSGNPFRLANIADGADAGTTAGDAISEKIGVCTVCHGGSGYLGMDSANEIDATHYGSDHTAGGKGGELCWDCHDPHGDYKYSATAGLIGFMIDETPKRTHTVAAGSATEWGQSAIAYAATPVFRANLTGGATTYDWGDYVQGTSLNGVCQVCHTATNHFLNSVWDDTAPGDFDHNTSQGCAVTCHKHDQPATDAFKGAGVCSSCHLAAASPGSDSDVDDYAYGTAPQAMVDRDDWEAYGHGAAAAFAQSGNPAPAFPVTSTVEGCYYCHVPDTAIAGGNGDTSVHGDATDPFRLTNTGGADGKNGVCMVCHKASSPGFDPDGANAAYAARNRTTSQVVGSRHYGLDHSATGDGGEFCWDCHDPHGDYNYTVGTARAIAYMIHETPVRDHSGSAGWGVPTALGAAVDFNKAAGVDATGFDSGDYVDTGAPTYNGVCQVCHTATNHWRSDGSLQHENGGPRCRACHVHEQPTQNAFRESTACNACHNAPPTGGKHGAHDATGTTITSYTSTTNYPTPTAYGFTCGICHTAVSANHLDDLGGTTSDPYVVDVDFYWDAVTYAQGGTPTTETHATSGLVFRSTNGSCTTTYCHDPQGTSYTSTAVTWDAAAGGLSCTGCHDDAYNQTLTNLPYAHDKHASAATSPLSYNFGCEKCHDNTVSDYQTLRTTSGQGKVQHVDNDKDDVKFSTVGSPAVDQSNGLFSGTGASVTCSSTYCHSDGQTTLFPFGGLSSPAWNGSTAAECTSCHRGDSASLTPMNSGSHTAHIGSWGCTVCHNSTVTGASNRTVGSTSYHVNGVADVAISSSYDTNGATSNWNGTSCSSIRCHGSGTPTWGGSVTCSDCHRTATGATVDNDVDDYVYDAGTGTLAQIDGDDWRTYGHGRRSGDGNYAESSNPPANFDGATGTINGCMYCHTTGVQHGAFGTSTNPFRLANITDDDGSGTAGDSIQDKIHVCTVCHSPDADETGYNPGSGNIVASAATKTIDSYHYGDDHTGDVNYGGVFCWDCHDPHGDLNFTQSNAALGYMFQEFPVADSTGSPTVNTSWGVPTATGDDIYVNFSRATGGVSNAWDDRTDYYVTTTVSISGQSKYNGVCQVCHTHVGFAFTNLGTETQDTAHNSPGRCLDCHLHQQGAGMKNKAFRGLGTCLTCHGSARGPRVAVTTDFTRASHHVSNGTTTSIVTNYDCILCHAEGDLSSSGSGASENIVMSTTSHGNDSGTTTVDLRDVDSNLGTGIAVAWTGSRGTPLGNGTSYTTLRDSMDTFCMNCHDADGAATVAVNGNTDGMLTGSGYWINANSGQVSRATNVVTVNTTAAHGLAVNNTVILEVPTEANFPPGVKVVTAIPTTTQFRYAETAANATSTRALKFIRVGQSSSGSTTRASGSATVSVTTTQAHGFGVGNTVLLRTGSNNTTSGVSSYTHSYYFRAGVKTVVSVPSSTQFTYTEDTAASPNPTSNQTSNQEFLFTRSIDRAVTPFNTADRLAGSTNEGAALKGWRWQANGRLVDVKGQFNAANAYRTDWASHHNLNQFAKRYGTRNTTYWPNAGWTTWTTKEGSNIQTAGETAGLHCSDCHLNETNAHGTTGNYYMMSNSSGADTAFTGVSTTSSTDLCVKCHINTTYGIGNTSTASRTAAHNASGARCQNWTTTGIEVAIAGNGTTPTLPCLGCHGGLSPGMIHGTNTTYNPGKSGTWTSKRWRFMGTGGAMRFYSPNSSTTGSDTTWTTSQSVGCYTVDEALDTFGGCSNHNSGFASTTSARARPLDY